jgi:NADH:ubiquinone oxidoreductase subunit F (NADH-binding)
MSKKILLDKISIPGIKPMKYTVKRWLRFSGKAMKAMTPDEVVDKLRHLDFAVVVVLVSCWIEMSFIDKNPETKTLVCNADESEPERSKIDT